MTQEEIKLKVSGALSAEEVVAAFQAQSLLFEKFISMARSPDEPEVTKAMLRETIRISTELTGAELGSLILLDSDGVVVDSILSRGEINPELRSMLINSVLQEGLAGWVMRHRKIGLVHDTEKDDRWLIFPDQPYMARSALALPIISNEMLLGVLTLLHPRPNHFTKKIVELINITVNQVALVLENVYFFDNLNDSLQSLGKANKQIEAYSQALDRELEKCRQIQKDFLPKQLPQLDNWYMEEFFFPASRVSGDFYDVFSLGKDKKLALVIADVCDKGVSAALFMGIFRSLIHAYLESAFEWDRQVQAPRENQHTPGALSEKSLGALVFLNNYIEKHHGREGIFATLFFGVLNPATGTLSYVNGGHEPLFVINAGNIKDRFFRAFVNRVHTLRNPL